MDKKTLNYTIHSSKKHRQYESNKVNSTATKHSHCPGNEKLHHICNFVHFCFKNNKNTAFKKHKNIKKNKINIKNMFFSTLIKKT